MHADEVATDVALVRQLLRNQHPHWADLAIERVPSSGTDNALYRLGDDLAVRLPRIQGTAGNVDKEQGWMPVLGPQLPLPIPLPVARGEADATFPIPGALCSGCPANWRPATQLRI